MLNKIIKILRLANDLSKTELGTISGVSVSYLTEIEQGKKSPSMKTMKALAKSFHVSVPQMLFFEVMAEEGKMDYQSTLQMVLEYYVENKHVYQEVEPKKKTL